MNPIFSSMLYVVARRLARHQGRPPVDARRVPLWRLLGDEVVYLAKRSLRRDVLVVWVPVCVVFVAIVVAFAEATPGPVVPLGWRLLVAAGAGVAAGLAARRWIDSESEWLVWAAGAIVAREALHGIAVVVAFAAVILLARAVVALVLSAVF